MAHGGVRATARCVAGDLDGVVGKEGPEQCLQIRRVATTAQLTLDGARQVEREMAHDFGAPPLVPTRAARELVLDLGREVEGAWQLADMW